MRKKVVSPSFAEAPTYVKTSVDRPAGEEEEVSRKVAEVRKGEESR